MKSLFFSQVFPLNRTTACVVLLLLGLSPVHAFAQARDFEVFGTGPDQFLGTSIACSGTNVFAGAPQSDFSSFTDVGEVRIFDFASRNVIGTIPYPVTSSNDRLFGQAVHIMPDTNSNTSAQVIVSAPIDPSSFGIPAVYIFDEGGTSPVGSINGQSDDRFGTTLASIDFPVSDGISDLIIGAPARPGAGTGAVEIYDITNPATPQLELLITAPGGTSELGASMSVISDLDGNGSPDLIVGAPGTGDDEGSVFFYSFTPANHSVIRELHGPTSATERFGTSVSAIGDVNGDLVEDVLIGSRGVARLYSGADIRSSATIIVPLCEIVSTPSTGLGVSVTSAGDVDKDGRPDFAVGVPTGAGNPGEIRMFTFIPGTGCSHFATLGGSGTENLGKYVTAAQCGPATNPPLRLVAGTSSSSNGAGAGSAIVFGAFPTATPSPTPTVTPTPTAPPPPPLPSRAELTFRISENGEFRITRTYNNEPTDDCSYTTYGRVKIGSRLLPIEKLDSGTFSTGVDDEGESVIRILNFPRAQKVDNVKPVFNMIVRTTCGSDTFDSNVFARFMNCGVPETSVDIDTWVETLKRGLTRAASQQSVRSDRNVKVVRLKKRRPRK